MRNIKTDEGFAILYNHDIKFNKGCSTVSTRHFKSKKFIDMLNKLFNTKPWEKIDAIEIKRDGITAYFAPDKNHKDVSKFHKYI